MIFYCFFFVQNEFFQRLEIRQGKNERENLALMISLSVLDEVCIVSLLTYLNVALIALTKEFQLFIVQWVGHSSNGIWSVQETFERNERV